MATVLSVLWLAPSSALASKTLADYRYFRALSIDLQGRTPTAAELTAFESDSFDAAAWVDARLLLPDYATRMRRIFMDAMRLQIGSTFQYVQGLTTLRRVPLTVNGTQTFVYFRRGQRRVDANIDGDFCFSTAETGLSFVAFTDPVPVAGMTVQDMGAYFDPANLTLGPNSPTPRVKQVYPWWLYYDYDVQATGGTPVQRYGAGWTPNGYAATTNLGKAPDKATDLSAIWACAEEALQPATGHVWARGSKPAPTSPRVSSAPSDSQLAKDKNGQPIDCANATAFANAVDCGCGVGLERCTPADSSGFDPGAFNFSQDTPLGFDQPFDPSDQAQSSWTRLWWGQEAVHFLDDIFSRDADVRTMLTSHATFVNGPLVQFYKYSAQSTCCGGQSYYFGYPTPVDPLFALAGLPAIKPQDATTWARVDDRGAHASGVLTMPVFLTKYGTRRARAHVLYNAFWCRDFIASNVQLKPSTEPNLMIRDGCSACHATLEPLAAYFTRIVESSWTYLPPAEFPVSNAKCQNADPKKINGNCTTFYDPAFATATQSFLRGAYGSPANADLEAAGIAAELTADPKFPTCMAQQVASSFLGRALTDDDSVLTDQLTGVLQQNGFQMRQMVRTLLLSDRYKNSNSFSPSFWRQDQANGGAP